MAKKLECKICGKVSDEPAQKGLLCGRCGSEIPVPPPGTDYFKRPHRKKKRNKKKQEPVETDKDSGTATGGTDRTPPPIKRPFDYDHFFQKVAQFAVVAGVCSFIMLVVFMSIDRQQGEGPQPTGKPVAFKLKNSTAVEEDKSPDSRKDSGKDSRPKPSPEVSVGSPETSESNQSDKSGKSNPGQSRQKNNPPDFPDHTFTLLANVAEGGEIGKLKASDPDGDMLTYEITENANANQDQRPSVRLAGDLLVVNDAGDFRRQNNSPIKLRAKASDGRLSDDAMILLNLEKSLAIESIKDHRGVEMAVGLIECSVEVIDRVTKAKQYSQDLRVLRSKQYISKELLDFFGVDDPKKLHPKDKEEYEEILKEILNSPDFQGRYDMSSGGWGTCFLISPDGYAITNRHVVQHHLEAQIPPTNKYYKYLSDNMEKYTGFRPQLLVFLGEKNRKRHYKARVLHVSPVEDEDIAIIKIEGVSNSPFFKLAKYEDIHPLTDVYSLGYPGVNRKSGTSKKDIQELNFNKGSLNPDDWHPDNHLTLDRDKGIVNKIDVHDGDLRIVQHTAELSGGNSGGPLVTDDGHVVGVNHSGMEGAKHFYATPPYSIVDELRKFPQIKVEWVAAFPEDDQ